MGDGLKRAFEATRETRKTKMNKPSEKEMQLAGEYVQSCKHIPFEFEGIEQETLATLIDAHTAPYKKALDEAERALIYAEQFVPECSDALTTIRAIKGE